MFVQTLYRRRLQTLGVAILMVVAVLASANPSDEAVQNQTIVREAFEAWAEGESVFGELLARDMRWTIHGSGPVAGTYVGIDSFVEDASRPLISRLSTPLVPEVHAIWAVEDTVIVRFDGSATTTSGAPYENQFVWIFRMDGGQVAEAEAFLDLVAYQRVVDNNDPREE